MKLIVLAGGIGSRLQSVLEGKPKPLASINGTPFIDILISNWIEQGIRDFVFSLHFEASQLRKHIESLKNTLLRDCNIEYVVEEKLLGTGGAINYVIKKLKIEGFFLVANADTYLSNGIAELTSLGIPAIAVVKIDDVSRFGTIEMNDEGLITRFNEKNNIKSSGLINAGLYYLNSAQFSANLSEVFSVEIDLFPLLVNKENLNACTLNAEFIDIGIPSDYHKFCEINQNKL